MSGLKPGPICSLPKIAVVFKGLGLRRLAAALSRSKAVNGLSGRRLGTLVPVKIGSKSEPVHPARLVDTGTGAAQKSRRRLSNWFRINNIDDQADCGSEVLKKLERLNNSLDIGTRVPYNNPRIKSPNPQLVPYKTGVLC
jgi:hypothetical protein